MGQHPVNFIIIAGFVFILTNQFLKRTYFTKIDPLMYITLHSSLVVSAVLYEAAFINSIVLFVVVLMHLSFLVGILVTHSLLPYKQKLLSMKTQFQLYKSSLRRTMLIFCCVYIVFAVTVWVNFGLLILSDDPEFYKLQFASGGLGFVFRLSTALTIPVFFFVFLGWRGSSPVCKIIAIIALMLVFASSGKSILINAVIVGLIVSIYKSKVLGEIILQSYLRIFFIALLALGFSIVVLYLAYGDSVNAEGQSIVFAFFIERISTAPGLGLTTYLQNRSYFDGIIKGDAFSYLWNYLIVPVAAPLRLTEYVPTVARELGIFITGGEDYGPNPTLYTEGIVYFGLLFGWIYAFGIGCLISILRYLAVTSAVIFTPVIGALAFVYLYSAILSLSTDFLVFMSFITSYLFIFLIIYIFSILQKIVKASLI